MQMSRNNVMTANDTNIYTQLDDVYADITPSASTYATVDEKDEMLLNIQQKLGEVSAPTAQIEQQDNLTNPDIMPSETTMRLGFQRNYKTESNEQVANKSALSTRQKVYVGVYVAVVLLLILAVTLCGVAISNNFASIGTIEAEYAQKIAELEALNEVVNADNYDALLEKATEMGYVQIDDSNSNQYTQLETRPAQNYNIKSNWFNDLCEWLSGVFGG